MPYRIVMHNAGDEESYRRVDLSEQVPDAIRLMVAEHGDIWRDGDSIVVFKITDVEAKNEDFWDDLTKEMREGKR